MTTTALDTKVPKWYTDKTIIVSQKKWKNLFLSNKKNPQVKLGLVSRMPMTRPVAENLKKEGTKDLYVKTTCKARGPNNEEGFFVLLNDQKEWVRVLVSS